MSSVSRTGQLGPVIYGEGPSGAAAGTSRSMGVGFAPATASGAAGRPYKKAWPFDDAAVLDLLRNGEFKLEQELKPQVQILRLQGGAYPLRAIFKADDRPREQDIQGMHALLSPVAPSVREAMYYELDQVCGLGLVPPTVRVSHPSPGSLQLFVEGLDSDAKYTPKELATRRAQCNREAAERLRAFDVIFGHVDRHTENSPLVEVNGERLPAAIDNELTLPDGKAFQLRPFSLGTDWIGPPLPSTSAWLAAIDRRAVAQTLHRGGFPRGVAIRALRVLETLSERPGLIAFGHGTPEATRADLLLVDRHASRDALRRCLAAVNHAYGPP